jgi:predicted ATP-dependent serine protease
VIKFSSNPDELPRIVAKVQPQLIIVDSIHSMKSERTDMRGRAGHHTQAKYTSELVVSLCKDTGAAALLISHISNGYFKGGPQVEHWVDAAMLMRKQIVRGDKEGEEPDIRRVAKITKSRFCEVTGWRDITVREWSQSYFHAKRMSSEKATREVDPALAAMLDLSTNKDAAAEEDPEVDSDDEKPAPDDEFELELE